MGSPSAYLSPGNVRRSKSPTSIMNLSSWSRIYPESPYKKPIRRRKRKRRLSYSSWSMIMIGIAAVAIATILLCCFAPALLTHRQGLRQQVQNELNIGRLRRLNNNNDNRNKLAEAVEFDPSSYMPDKVIHVIQTRIMQFQPNLLDLGKARLEVFKTFCLPTMVMQSNQNFVWIIRTDPELNKELREQLVRILQPYPNFILVASNTNPEGFRNKDSIADVMAPLAVWSGRLELVQKMHEAAQTRPLLETRLDADDGLHLNFVSFMQEQALQHLVQGENEHGDNYKGEEKNGTTAATALHGNTTQSIHHEPRWRIWCVDAHLEWHYASPFSSSSSSENRGGGDTTTTTTAAPPPVALPISASRGYLVGLRLNQCITAGMTFGYGLNTQRHDLPKFPHDKLMSHTPPCAADYDDNHHLDADKRTKATVTSKKQHTSRHHNCLSRMMHPSPGAIRARTPTSAGMANVMVDDDVEAKGSTASSTTARNHLHKTAVSAMTKRSRQLYSKAKWQKNTQEEMWAGLGNIMGVTKENCVHTRSYLKQNLIAIAVDNLKGQCTKGHSCKETSKKVLQSIVQSAGGP